MVECVLCGVPLASRPYPEAGAGAPDLKALEALGELLSSDPVGADEPWPTLTLPEYRKRVASIPVPEPLQMEAFADYVSGAHSWYKYLPYLLPGARCVFFVNPCAMMENARTLDADRTQFRPYVDGEWFLHYSTMTTSKYRSRFGCLDYVIDAEVLAAPFPVGEPRRGVLEAHRSVLPAVIGESCATRVTAVLHPLAARPWCWRKYFPRDSDASGWPEASGGRDRLAQILALCRERDDRDEGAFVRLTELLRSERDRQLQGMVAAMRRLTMLLWG